MCEIRRGDSVLKGILKKGTANKTGRVTWPKNSLIQIKYYDPNESILDIENDVEEKLEKNGYIKKISWINLLVGAAGIELLHTSQSAPSYFRVIGLSAIISIAILKTIFNLQNKLEDESENTNKINFSYGQKF